MSEAPRIALAGNPNCGKTSLFNAITGGRQKVGNYPGVTVERKEGTIISAGGTKFCLLDLPGTYSLDAKTPDEEVTRDMVLGLLPAEAAPELLVAVADATNLERNLGLVLELRALGRSVVLALNMMDLARQRGIELDLPALARELRVPVVPTVAVKREGISELLREIEDLLQKTGAKPAQTLEWKKSSHAEITRRFQEVDRILKVVIRRAPRPTLWTDRLDRVVLHPVWGAVFLLTVLGVMFQAIFTWAAAPMDAIKTGITALGDFVTAHLAAGPLQSLLVDGVITGVGSVLVFLPQILILFFFILILEDSGYMARAAFLMDRVMGKVGLHGRAIIPLLSSYACAVPGIMATRTIASRRDRFTTILIAPLTTCSARLPVYALLIGAFIPNKTVLGPLKLQGLVMMLLYLGGIVAALGVALVLRRTIFSGPKSPLLMELPTYKWPSVRTLAYGLYERAKLFVRRAGTVILSLSIVLWFVSSYPKPPAGAIVDDAHPAISYSYAGRVGHLIEPVLRPLGFDWRISIALIPGFAAREVMISALATVYSVEKKDDGVSDVLGQRLSKDWSLPSAISLLVWYVLAIQCLSTLAVTRRETNSWRWPFFMLLYMTVLAYVGSFVAYRIALGVGL